MADYTLTITYQKSSSQALNLALSEISKVASHSLGQDGKPAYEGIVAFQGRDGEKILRLMNEGFIALGSRIPEMSRNESSNFVIYVPNGSTYAMHFNSSVISSEITSYLAYFVTARWLEEKQHALATTYGNNAATALELIVKNLKTRCKPTRL